MCSCSPSPGTFPLLLPHARICCRCLGLLLAPSGTAADAGLHLSPDLAMQRFRQVRSSRKLTLESLEARLPLAGNVTASVVNGKLSVIGDTQANQIVIEQMFIEDGGPDGYQVRGIGG